MSLRYLFGPVPAEFANANLLRQRRAGACLTFDAAGSSDLAVTAADSWEAVCSRLPEGWRPDFMGLWLPYTTIPPCLWSAPVPLVGLAADWTLLWHHYRHCLRRCELVLTDSGGVDVLAREGIAHARAGNLFGLERAFLEDAQPEGERDIDILFVGNMHPAVQRERMPWLGRLARLGERRRVAIHSGVFGADYRRLLGRARIVFNLSIRGECNRRTFEAAAAAALLFQEADNREVPAFFRDGRECVCYTDDNLEERLAYYLDHEDERRAIAEAARARVARYSFEDLWDQHVSLIEQEWPGVTERVRERPEPGGVPALLARTWQALGSTEDDSALVAALGAALENEPACAALHNALGLAVTRAGQGQANIRATLAEKVAGHFERALACDPGHALAGLNLAEALVGIEQRAGAAEVARRTLALVNQGPAAAPLDLDAGHFPPGFDPFRVEWERAAWANAGRPAAEAPAKRQLLRWRLHDLLAGLTGEPAHAYEAALACPDLPAAAAELGATLALRGRDAEAVPHLRRALAGNPFDQAAARALFKALGAAGDADGQRRLARERRLLAAAAPQEVVAETWFTQAAPVGDELASLIILCCNELEYTRQCLESVLRHTRAPYELVLVDNGSTDGTPAYLEEVRTRPGPARVVVIRNESNRGFPAGCNQGLAEARGRYLVFLNNDTVVAEGWLERLIAWKLHDWPRVGMVGAVSNYTAAPQQVAIDYAGVAGLDAFAARRARDYAGKALEVGRLTGFCLLARREVFDNVGGFDERYELGFFDDDDLSVRARKAGFRLLVALNVFIHHYGSRTFQGLGIDCEQQLRTNFARFKEKWGPEEAAHYRLREAGPPAGVAGAERSDAPDCAPGLRGLSPGHPSPATPTVPVHKSLCIIARNEEANLPDCLRSAADLFDEIIVVDTGSTDRTKEIAAGFGARVFDFPWCDSFAAARNECLRHATGDWIFWMDADDRLDEENRHKLRALLAGLNADNAVYSMKCLCLPDPVTGTATVVDHIRLFRNDPQIRWEHRVHEQILPAARRAGALVRFAEVVIHHAGYQDPALRRRKLERDLRLLRLEEAEQPDHPFTLFNLGSVFHEMGQPAEALTALRRSLERSHPRDSIVRKLYALIMQCQRQLGRPAEALADCQAGRRLYPDDTELLFDEGLLRRALGDAAGAEGCWARLLQTREAAHFASVDAGLRGYKARHNLAVLYHEQGRHAEAAAQWQQALAEQPGFTPARVGLAEVYLAGQRWPELEQTLERLAVEPRAQMETAVLQARMHLARREFALARDMLAAAVVDHPTALWPRVILSHVLLQEGRDWGAAERALLEVLALAPDHAEARHNLAVLRATARPAQAA
jgi:GT2 family glycosyltransferase